MPHSGEASPSMSEPARLPPVRVALILNRDAGGGAASGQRDAALEALRAAGVEAEAVRVRPDEFTRTAREAARSHDAVVAAGGDGTVSSVAAGLVGGDTPLGVLPLGTLNHFAKDLGVPLDLEEAAAVIAAGNVRRVDVGEVNGRTFVNNSSIGAYPLAVTLRERLQEQHGYGKWLAMARASLTVFKRLPLLTVELRADGEPVELCTPIVFVGNDEYDVTTLPPGRRQRLDDGCLCVCTVRAEARRHLLLLAGRALLGRLHTANDLEARLVGELEVRVDRRSLPVAVDGEVLRLDTPLRYRTRPGALPVLAPPAADGDAA